MYFSQSHVFILQPLPTLPPSPTPNQENFKSEFFSFWASINTKTKPRLSQTVILFKAAERTCKNDYTLEIFSQ